jgi:hypothetical protein
VSKILDRSARRSGERLLNSLLQNHEEASRGADPSAPPAPIAGSDVPDRNRLARVLSNPLPNPVGHGPDAEEAPPAGAPLSVAPSDRSLASRPGV